MSDSVKVNSMDGELGLQVGDIIRVVVQDMGEEGDPLTFVDGAMTIIHDEQGLGIEFADTVLVKVADITGDTIHAVPIEVEG